MSKRSLQFLLADMLDCLDKTVLVIEGLTYDSFLKDIKAFHACLSLVAIMGEAAAQAIRHQPNLPDTLPWHHIRGMRNRLVHEYFDVDSATLWMVVSEEFPKLRAPLIALQASLQ